MSSGALKEEVEAIREYEKAKEKGNLRLVSIEDFEKRK